MTKQEIRDGIIEKYGKWAWFIRMDENKKPIYGCGIAHFENLTIEGIKELLKHGFIDEVESQNNSPTTKEFIEFMDKFPQFTAIGYVVEEDRDDFRTTLTGIEFKLTPEDKIGHGASNVLKTAFESFSETADEINSTDNCLNCWWD